MAAEVPSDHPIAYGVMAAEVPSDQATCSTPGAGMGMSLPNFVLAGHAIDFAAIESINQTRGDFHGLQHQSAG